jgi:orotate phosphoribosyltransferase
MLNTNFLITKALIRSKALKFGCFKLKSGLTSPYYIDLSWLLSSPLDFKYLIEVVTEEIKHEISSKKIDKLASIELKGALFLPIIGIKTNIPCIIVRKEKKAYGLEGKIVGGEVNKGEKIIFFDELITKGISILKGITTIEEAGGYIEKIIIIVDREQGGIKNLEDQGYKVKSIIKISEILKNIRELNFLPKEKIEKISNYLDKK